MQQKQNHQPKTMDNKSNSKEKCDTKKQISSPYTERDIKDRNFKLGTNYPDNILFWQTQIDFS